MNDPTVHIALTSKYVRRKEKRWRRACELIFPLSVHGALKCVFASSSCTFACWYGKTIPESRMRRSPLSNAVLCWYQAHKSSCRKKRLRNENNSISDVTLYSQVSSSFPSMFTDWITESAFHLWGKICCVLSEEKKSILRAIWGEFSADGCCQGNRRELCALNAKRIGARVAVVSKTFWFKFCVSRRTSSNSKIMNWILAASCGQLCNDCRFMAPANVLKTTCWARSLRPKRLIVNLTGLIRFSSLLAAPSSRKLGIVASVTFVCLGASPICAWIVVEHLSYCKPNFDLKIILQYFTTLSLFY